MPSAAYLGNENLKGQNTIISFTEEQLLELERCRLDPVYFINNYVKIINVDEGLVNFKLYPYQEKLVHLMHDERFLIGRCPRQSGKTTSTMGYILHFIIFTPNSRVALLANKGSTARVELLGRLQGMFENIPNWMQQGIVSWNKGSLELENGSRVIAAATSASAIRGGSYNCVVLDEFAHVLDNIAEEFFTSTYPVISSGKTTKLFIISTPKGMNLFYKMWNDSISGKNRFKSFEITWRDRPGYTEEWAEETIAQMGLESFQQEFECEFFGSSNTLISGSKLKILASQYIDPLYSQDKLDIYVDPCTDKTVAPNGDVILTPRKYAICADTAKGKFLDYSAFVIVDITEIPYRVVGKYKDNTISPIEFPNVLLNVAKRYNDAFILVEINDVGNQVAQALVNDLEYENVLKVVPNGRGGQHLSTGYTKSTQLGLNMTGPAKKLGCSNLKTIVERDKLLIPDFDIIQELTTFIKDGANFAADEGKHDDLVMCLVSFSWMVQDTHFRQLVDLDLREKMKKENEALMEFNSLPFGFLLNDGLNLQKMGQKFKGDNSVWFETDTPSFIILPKIHEHRKNRLGY